MSSKNKKKKVIDLGTKEGEAYLRKHNPGLTAESRDLQPWTIIPKKKPKKKSHGGEIRVPGSGAAVRGTGFKGIF